MRTIIEKARRYNNSMTNDIIEQVTEYFNQRLMKTFLVNNDQRLLNLLISNKPSDRELRLFIEMLISHQKNQATAFLLKHVKNEDIKHYFEMQLNDYK